MIVEINKKPIVFHGINIGQPFVIEDGAVDNIIFVKISNEEVMIIDYSDDPPILIRKFGEPEDLIRLIEITKIEAEKI